MSDDIPFNASMQFDEPRLSIYVYAHASGTISTTFMATTETRVPMSRAQAEWLRDQLTTALVATAPDLEGARVAAEAALAAMQPVDLVVMPDTETLVAPLRVIGEATQDMLDATGITEMLDAGQDTDGEDASGPKFIHVRDLDVGPWGNRIPPMAIMRGADRSPSLPIVAVEPMLELADAGRYRYTVSFVLAAGHWPEGAQLAAVEDGLAPEIIDPANYMVRSDGIWHGNV